MEPATPVSGINKRIIKEPLGFLRILELPMAILAFATTSAYSESISIPYTCAGTGSGTKQVEFGYPFDLTNIKLASNFCVTSYATGSVIPFMSGASSQAQFFVCTGVLSFLYVLCALTIYLLSWAAYKRDPRYAMADFGITGVLAVFWFIGSCAWASGVTLVKTVTTPEAIGERLRRPSGSFPCNGDPTATVKMCTPTLTWNYAALNISLIVGFACCGLWAANLWFIYKETVWYKNRQGAMGVVAPPSGGGGSVNASSQQIGQQQQPQFVVPPSIGHRGASAGEYQY